MDDLMAFRAAMSNERVAPAPAVVAVVRRRGRNGRVVNMVVVKLEGVLWGVLSSLSGSLPNSFSGDFIFTRFRRPDSGDQIPAKTPLSEIQMLTFSGGACIWVFARWW